MAAPIPRLPPVTRARLFCRPLLAASPPAQRLLVGGSVRAAFYPSQARRARPFHYCPAGGTHCGELRAAPRDACGLLRLDEERALARGPQPMQPTLEHGERPRGLIISTMTGELLRIGLPKSLPILPFLYP